MRRSIVPTTFAAVLAFASTFAWAQVDDGSLDKPGKQHRTPVQQPTLKQSGSPAVRSAQSDCVREANRRGFAVLETTNFQQFREGWSIDLRVRDARGRVQQGSCFVETRTGDVDLDGFGWGWEDGGDERFEFNCSSVEGKHRECQLPINGRARLVKRRSDDGCRAKFEVVRSGGGGSGNTIDCMSEDGRYRECSIGPGRFGRLVREYSHDRCRADRTWGTRNGVIWVTDGCRARFEIRRGNSGNVGGGGRTGSLSLDEAKRACAREVERYGHKVKDVSAPVPSADDYRLTLKIRAVSGEQRTVGCRVDQSSGKVRLYW
jgi:hypothetical protein